MKLQPLTADIGVCPKNPHINTDLLILCGHPLALIPKGFLSYFTMSGKCFFDIH